MTGTNSNGVSLTVPARGDYVVLARLALSAVCRLTRLAAEDVADLKLAMTEAATSMVDYGGPGITFEFRLEDDRLVVDLEGSADAAPEPLSSEDGELGRAILEATVDESEFRAGGLRLVKYVSPAAE